MTDIEYRQCRKCRQLADSTSGMCWMPSKGAYFKAKDQVVDWSKTLFLCRQCFVDHVFRKIERDECRSCHLLVDKFKSVILTDGSDEVWKDQKSYRIINLPILPIQFYKQHETVCQPCFDKFVDQKLIVEHHIVDNKSQQCDICLRTNDDANNANNAADDNNTLAINPKKLRIPAHFLTNTKFSVFCGGIFETSQPVEFKSNKHDSWTVCSDCLEKIEYKPYLSVNCDNCHEKYQSSMDIDGPQGWGCCASISEEQIFCGYGSDRDQARYKWVGGLMPDKYRTMDNICDSCLDKMTEDKIIKRVDIYK